MNTKKKSSVITPPPKMPDETGPSEVFQELTEEQRKEGLLKLIKRGAPSVPLREREAKEEDKRLKYTLRIVSSLMERINRAAASRDIMTPVNTWVTDAITMQLKKEGF